MSSKRAPAPPPAIPGYEHVSLIGSGGFSDVFLYEQQRPRRRVAVKVLLHEWANAQQRAAFDAEADLMARLSTHPSIVTIYEADIASDGRPYLAMEYCSRPSLGTRYRSERLGLAECLRVVVQIAGAVETAHRAGILHRDIKPANILGTDYGHPVLTDFGISSTVDDVARAEGLSIPWSPPESFGDPPTAGVGTDVWALGATLYSFLAGRSPFEVPGGSNGSADLVQRICAQPLAPTGRSDVPPSLELVLATSMAKDPAGRYRSVLDFARALQQVQIELALGVTPIDLLGDTGVVVVEDEADDEPGTRLRGVVSIDPAGAPEAARGQGRGPGVARFDGGGGGGGAVGPVEHLSSGPSGTAGAPARPAARAVPPTFDLAPPPVRPAPRDPAQMAVVHATGPAPTPVAPEAAPPARPGRSAPPASPAPSPVWAGSGSSLLSSNALPEPVDDTVLRYEPTSDEQAAGQGEAPARRRRLWPLAIAGALVVALAGGGVALALSHDGATPEPKQTGAAPPHEHPAGTVDQGPSNDNLSDLVPAVTDLVGTLDPSGRTATFTWKFASQQNGDTFAWKVVDPLRPDASYAAKIPERTVTVPVGKDGDVCVQVVAVRDGKLSAESTNACLKEH